MGLGQKLRMVCNSPVLSYSKDHARVWWVFRFENTPGLQVSVHNCTQLTASHGIFHWLVHSTRRRRCPRRRSESSIRWRWIPRLRSPPPFPAIWVVHSDSFCRLRLSQGLGYRLTDLPREQKLQLFLPRRWRVRITVNVGDVRRREWYGLQWIICRIGQSDSATTGRDGAWGGLRSQGMEEVGFRILLCICSFPGPNLFDLITLDCEQNEKYHPIKMLDYVWNYNTRISSFELTSSFQNCFGSPKQGNTDIQIKLWKFTITDQLRGLCFHFSFNVHWHIYSWNLVQ